MARKPVNFSALAGSVVSELRKADPERPVDTAIAEGIMVDGDERLLRVVLDNLNRQRVEVYWKMRTTENRIRHGSE
jgi:hypothetical protein